MPASPDAPTANAELEAYLEMALQMQQCELALRPAPARAPRGGALGCFDAGEKIALDGGAAHDVVVGDFDGDGHPDVLVAYADDGLVGKQTFARVYRGGDRGVLTAQPRFEIDHDTISLYVGDLDNDGKLDVVADRTVFDGHGTSSLRVLHNRGDGTFAIGAEHALAPFGYVGALADLGGDGHVELVIGGPRDVEIWTAGFARKARFAGGLYPQGFAIGDVDGDGHADLAWYSNDDRLRVARGRGDGTFGAPVAVATCPGLHAIHLVDRDGDGTLDAMVDCGGKAQLGVVPSVGKRGAALATFGPTGAYDFAISGGVVLGFKERDGFDIASDLVAIGRDGAAIGRATIDGQVAHETAVDLDGDGIPDVVASLWPGRPPGYLIVWRGRPCAAR